MLRIKTFGGLAVTRDSTAIVFHGMRDRALLAYLASQSRAVPRERIAGLLWSDRTEEQARQSLRQSLTTLRKAGVPIDSEGRLTITLGAGIDSDIRSFDTLAGRTEPESQAAAITLYEGQFLEGWTGDTPLFNDWLATQRTRTSELAVGAIIRLLASSYPRLQEAERLFYARKALSIDPYHEEAHRHEIDSLLALGLRSEAVTAASGFARLLHEELGVVPAPETTAMHESLRQPAIASSPLKQRRLPRIGVFPLDDVTSDPANTYLCQGIMAEVAAALSRFHSLQVVAPGSTFRLSADVDRHEKLRRGLNTDFALEGHFHAAPAEARVTMQLVDLREGDIVWSESVSGLSVRDANLPSIIAHSIASRVDAQVGSRVTRREPLSDSDVLAAYDSWLRGQYLSEKWTHSVESIAEAHFRRAIALDPKLARAHSSLALLLNGRIIVAPGYPNENVDRRSALHHARLAIEYDANDPRSHLAMSWISLFLCDHAKGARHAQLAFELNPHGADNIMHVALIRAYLGDAVRGLPLAEEATGLNPLHPGWYDYMTAQIHLLSGDFERALAIGLPVAADYLELPGWMAVAAGLSGDYVTASRMTHMLEQATAEAWSGSTPWTRAAAVEWFMSVNRWLQGRERDIMIRGLTAAHLL